MPLPGYLTWFWIFGATSGTFSWPHERLVGFVPTAVQCVFITVNIFFKILIHWLTEWQIHWITDQLNDRLAEWMRNLLPACLLACLPDWLTDWLTDWWTDGRMDRRTNRPMDWLTGRLTGWLDGWPTNQVSSIPTFPCTYTLPSFITLSMHPSSYNCFPPSLSSCIRRGDPPS